MNAAWPLTFAAQLFKGWFASVLFVGWSAFCVAIGAAIAFVLLIGVLLGLGVPL